MKMTKDILDKLFGEKLFNKYITVPIVLATMISLGALGFNIQLIQEFEYSKITLLIMNILLIIFGFIIIIAKINEINSNVNINKTYLEEFNNLIENINNNYDSIIHKIEILLVNNGDMIVILKEINEELKGIPNIKALHLILELKNKGLWNELFNDCLNYTLTYNQNNAKIIDRQFEDHTKKTIKNYMDFVKKNIKLYRLNPKMLPEIETVIAKHKKLINDEISKDKRIDEKLYTISNLLQAMHDDINALVERNLREQQTNI
ncbi:MAG: hypothetical protein PHT94_00930 [Candidatus Nanoarchaeia archaeon]|nr:hypothetical protein [Candidatus Nanoarchaeia archaeon]